MKRIESDIIEIYIDSLLFLYLNFSDINLHALFLSITVELHLHEPVGRQVASSARTIRIHLFILAI